VDGSGSVGPWGWTDSARFAKNMIQRMHLSYDDGAMMSVVLFARNVDIIHELTDDKAVLDSAIDRMYAKSGFPGGSTQTGEGVSSALKLLKGGREGVPGVVFVITDGKPTQEQPMKLAADAARDGGIRLHFVGVGGGIAPKIWDKMAEWATAPAEMNVIHVAAYEEFDWALSQMVSNLCPKVECRESFEMEDETDYMGCQTETTSGLTCQKWTAQSPHRHWFNPYWRYWRTGEPIFPNIGDFNFCRNPHLPDIWREYDWNGHYQYKHGGGIWCYTIDPETEWQYCDPRNVTSLPGQVF